MVKVCSYNYPKTEEEGYEEYYTWYSHPLHDFQKWALKAIVTGHNALICCPTGSGKTLPGEFSIQYFHAKGKKVIYASPIKALSNEKFHNFTKKYQHISFGLITGDIKTNPDADCLIMTTEILLNKLYQIKSTNTVSCPSSVSFDMDIENELGCVIFDEIHFINDEHRGHIWEQSIMLLPEHIQMIGLSATLDNPEKFAFWLETKGDPKGKNNSKKEVYLARKQNRAVPLIHYSFITATNGVNKAIKDKATQEEIKRIINKPWVIQDEKNVFNDVQYQTINKMLKMFEKHDIRVKRHHVLNKVAEYLVEKEMLPALCYVFSRKQLEKCAEEMTTNLLEFDSKVPYTVDRECEQIIRKLPNYEEYLHLPEYITLVKLLRKGVGIHHAGLMPILREMVELLFARGFIKILFCTETMSVGINLPVKTTIFTDINKFNGEINRTLYAHEYTQSSGRAGRLGLDTVGHVIHLNNLFRNVDSVMYKQMMNNKPQTLMSKFKISYNLILNLLDIGDNNLVQFASKSMITGDLDIQMKLIYHRMANLEAELETSNQHITHLRTPIDIIKQYNELQNSRENAVNKKRKEIERRIQEIQDNYKFLQQDRQTYEKIGVKERELDGLKEKMKIAETYFQSGVGTVLELLRGEKFIEDNTNPNPTTCLEEQEQEQDIKLTMLGKTASQIREIHCLVFAKQFEDKTLDTLSAKQLVSLFSCFTNIRVQEDVRDIVPRSSDQLVNNIVNKIVDQYNDYKNKELAMNIDTGFDYEIHFDLLNYVEKWCDSDCVEDCKWVLQEMAEKKEIFLGEFVKALLKINNISCEFEKIAEMSGNIAFLSKLKEIPNMTLKYVVTNQSLYV
jgi:superfamily II RNA helicase